MIPFRTCTEGEGVASPLRVCSFGAPGSRNWATRTSPSKVDEKDITGQLIEDSMIGLSDGADLLRRYYEDRKRNFPPDHERDPGEG